MVSAIHQRKKILTRELLEYEYNLWKTGKAAGINDDIQMTEYKGGIRKDIKLKKYEAVGTHTARRSFFTNAVISGVPVHLLMDMAGKKSEKEFWSYVCIEKELAAKTAKELPFFKTSFKDAVLKVV